LKLKKQPETELEYFEVIEGLGGFSWRMNHDLADGRIEDPDGKIGAGINEIQALLEQLVSEVCEKFGVIHPKDCPKRSIKDIQNDVPVPPAPEGKKYYWDWYEKQKRESYSKEYGGLICSACPFSEGLERMMTLGGQIPCGEFRGSIYHLSAPYRCEMLENRWGDGWTQEYLFERIRREHGEEALERFRTKLQALQPSPQPVKA
jgi:hypothetical protein